MANYADYACYVRQVEAAVKQAVNWFRRKFSLGSDAIDREELLQQGWAVALAALQNYDPAKGPLGGYLYTAIRRQLGNHITKAGSPVSIYGDWLACRNIQSASIDEAVKLASGAPNPEQAQLAQERLVAAALWQAKFDAAVESTLSIATPQAREAFCRQYGINGYAEQPPREIAKAMDLPVRSVYSMLARTNKAAFNSMSLYQVNRRLPEVAPNGIEEACDTSTY